MDKTKTKLYGLYLAYNQIEVTGDFNPNEPKYPREFARVRCYDNPTDQLNAYANTMCPASQCFEANSEEEFNAKVEEFKNNFENEEWVKENIEPYL